MLVFLLKLKIFLESQLLFIENRIGYAPGAAYRYSGGHAAGSLHKIVEGVSCPAQEVFIYDYICSTANKELFYFAGQLGSF